ncbi:MAG TPA: hypothetical protein VLS46_00985, partial [Gaiellaceae bacterium]|nr:hypothetical protein [Gaiellaceae bacterium]
FVKAAADGSGPAFDSVSWTDVSWSDVSWDSVSWSDVSWSDVSWSDVSWEDAAEGEFLDGDGHELTDPEAAAAAADPDLLTPEEAEALLSATSSLIP